MERELGDVHAMLRCVGTTRTCRWSASVMDMRVLAGLSVQADLSGLSSVTNMGHVQPPCFRPKLVSECPDGLGGNGHMHSVCCW